MTIRKPSEQEVNRYLKRWGTLENYVIQEKSLKKLFVQIYPRNNKMEDILIKVCSLNDFYSTNIYSPFKVARHIVSLNIDKKLKLGKLDIVNEIAKVKMGRGKQYYFYSFATKYCSHHMPEVYPIYDWYLDKMLTHFKAKDKFAKFNKADLKNYPKYKEILTQFQEFYHLKKFNLKQIDKYLWLVGKKHFKRKYGKVSAPNSD
jgi:hypothetical protein